MKTASRHYSADLQRSLRGPTPARQPSWTHALLLAASFSAAACASSGNDVTQGEAPGAQPGAPAEQPGGDPGAPMDPNAPDTPPAVPAPPANAGECGHPDSAAPRILSPGQYINMLQDVFSGIPFNTFELVSTLPNGLQVFGHRGGAPLNTPSTLQSYLDTSTLVAPQIISWIAGSNADATPLDTAHPVAQACSAASRACAEVFLANFGRAMFRRSLTAAEQDAYLAFFDSELGLSGEPDAALTMMIRALLVSPYVIYTDYPLDSEGAPAPAEEPTGTVGGLTATELQEAGLEVLSGVELATRLALLLWDSVPDTALLDAAETRALETDAQVAEQVARMIQDPRFERSVAAFNRKMFRLDPGVVEDKDPGLYPEATPTLFADSVAALNRFIVSIYREGGSFVDLHTSRKAQVSEPLAALYGVTPTGAAAADGSYEVELPEERAGVVTRAAFLAATSHGTRTSPTLRGFQIRDSLLCQAVPPPPPDVQDQFPTLDLQPDRTLRQSLTALLEEGEDAGLVSCSGCHRMMDGLGFSLEHFDAIGKYRTTDNDLPIDAAVELSPGFNGGTEPLALSGAVALAAELAKSDGVRACLDRQWFTYAFLRAPGESDQCSIEQISASVTTDASLADALVALVLTPSFRLRGAR